MVNASTVVKATVTKLSLENWRCQNSQTPELIDKKLAWVTTTAI